MNDLNQEQTMRAIALETAKQLSPMGTPMSIVVDAAKEAYEFIKSGKTGE